MTKTQQKIEPKLSTRFRKIVTGGSLIYGILRVEKIIRMLETATILRRAFALAVACAWVVATSAQDIDPSSGNAQPYPGTPVDGYLLSWSDEFNGTSLDTNKWNYRTGVRYLSTLLPENVAVSNGLLNIHLKRETVGETSYTAGGTISKRLFRYGFYEACMRVPPGTGWHSAF